MRRNTGPTHYIGPLSLTKSGAYPSPENAGKNEGCSTREVHGKGVNLTDLPPNALLTSAWFRRHILIEKKVTERTGQRGRRG